MKKENYSILVNIKHKNFIVIFFITKYKILVILIILVI